MSAKRGPRLLALAFAVIAASLGSYLLRRQREQAKPSTPAPSSAPGSATASTPTTPTTPTAPTTPTGSGSAASPVKRIDATARQRILEQLANARSRRQMENAPPAGDLPKPSPQPLDKDYIRTQVRALIPLLTECYTNALADDPKLAGKLVVTFTIGGEPDVGGIVETTAVDPNESTIAHPGMLECVRETMYAAEFVPPPEGGQVDVRYPFEFSN